MNPRYSTPITRREAQAYLRAYFGNVRLPAGAHYLWIAGVMDVGEHQHCYLRAAAGGLEGIMIVQAANEQAKERIA